jgi:hypothetical protein
VQRCADYGEEALAIRAVDLIDNCDRLATLFPLERLERVVKKLEMVEAVGRQHGLERQLLTDLTVRIQATRSRIIKDRADKAVDSALRVDR